MIKLKNLLVEEFQPFEPFSTKDPASNGKKVWITNDPWEYYLDKDTEVWWTRKRAKGGNWIDMKANLTDDRYQQALETLQAYIDARNKIESGGSYKSTSSTSTTSNKTTTAAPNKTSPLQNTDDTPIPIPVETPITRGKGTVDAKDIEMKEKPIEAGQRNYKVWVISQTPDGEYLEVRLPKRGILNRKPIVYVKASDFDVEPAIGSYSDGSRVTGRFATYNGKSGKKFDIFKAKRKKK